VIGGGWVSIDNATPVDWLCEIGDVLGLKFVKATIAIPSA
jgi:hypothetical protein